MFGLFLWVFFKQWPLTQYSLDLFIPRANLARWVLFFERRWFLQFPWTGIWCFHVFCTIGLYPSRNRLLNPTLTLYATSPSVKFLRLSIQRWKVKSFEGKVWMENIANTFQVDYLEGHQHHCLKTSNSIDAHRGLKGQGVPSEKLSHQNAIKHKKGPPIFSDSPKYPLKRIWSKP